MIRVVTALLVLLASTAGAEELRKRTEKGAAMWWKDRTFVYRIDPAGISDIPGTLENQTIDASFATWQRLSDTCSDFRFERGPDVAQPWIGFDEDHPERNYNAVTFRETACRDVAPAEDPCWDLDSDESCTSKYQCWSGNPGTIAVTHTTYVVPTGRILDADVSFNAASTAGDSGHFFTVVDGAPCPAGQPAPDCIALDVQNTLVHEIGHIVGFADLVDAAHHDSTMAAEASSGDTNKRTIDAATAAAFCAIYPKDRPTLMSRALGSGTNSRVYATNEGTGCTSSGTHPYVGLSALLIWWARVKRRGALPC